jgi:hypothetical protein
MYGTLKGVRNHHKGYKLVKIPDWTLDIHK